MQRKWKHSMLLAGLLVSLLMLLGGCGNGQEASGKQDKNETIIDQGQADTAESRIFKHAKGETEIPRNPQRIVTTHYLGDYLALGVKPIGSQGYLIADHYLQEAAQGVENIGEPPNPEQVLALSPDLIVVHDEDNYEVLKNIAPTVLIPWEAFNAEERLLQIGDLVNKKAEAEAWLQAFSQEVEAGKAKIAGHLQEGETVGFIWLVDKYIQVYTEHSILYRLLGLQQPAEVAAYAAANPDAGKVVVSLETLPDYSADHLFLITAPDEKTQSIVAETKASALWQGLPAVQKDQLYEVEETSWISSDPLSLQGQLREAVDILTAD